MIRTALPAVLVRSVALSLLLSSAHAQGLRWRSGETLAEPARGRQAARFDGALVRRLQQGSERHLLVRFESSPSRHERELLAASGLELGRALGHGAWFAHVRPERVDSAALARVGGLVDVRELELGWKMEPALLAGETPAWTVVSEDEAGEKTIAVYLLLHAGVDLAQGDFLLRELGGTTFDALESVNGLVAFVPRSRVNELAAADIVAWVEPALPQLETNATALPRPAAPLVNDSNRALTQAALLQAAPYNLDGGGVSVLVYDGGTARASHNDFGGRLTVRDGSGLNDHPTHVCGTVGGSGSASGGTFRGMAPGVTIESYGFQWNGVGIFFFTNPGDLESDYGQAINSFGAVLANNSIGTNTEFNGFPCTIQGDYGVFSSLIDGIVRGSLGAPMRVVWANGNERGGTRCDVEGFGSYYSVAPPAAAKNHITVGALNSNDDSMTSFSSWGPTDDGRTKPDVSAPGCQSNGDGGVTSTGASSDTNYIVFCGTSMAAPTTTGLSALIVEDWRAQFGGPDPLPSTLKVLLAHTAVDGGNTGPDFQFGYGSVRAKDAVDFMRLGRFVEGTLDDTGALARWTVSVAPATSELRLTLAWDDAPALPNVYSVLVNDLDLVVRDPLGAQHHVWTLDPANPSAAAVRTVADHRNNLEQVLVNSPMAGTWTVEVRGFDVPEGPQTFSLASSHALGTVPHLSISFPNGLPTRLEPGLPTAIVAHVVGSSESVVGTPTLHARFAGVPFLSFPMSPLGGDLYQASLPPGVCSATPEFYVSAQGSSSGTNTFPFGAPASTLVAVVASATTVFNDDFETNLGWTVTNVALTDGPWTRGVPVGGGTRGDPLNAFGGTGQCFLTDNVSGNSDVDGGPTQLTSPVMDLSAPGDYRLSYAYWFTCDTFDTDNLLVEISANNGSSWTTLENVTNGGLGGGWAEAQFDVGSFITPTSQVRLRFSASDNPNNSVTEAAVDAVRVVRLDCPSLADCNGNGILDSDDIASGRSADVNMNGVPDECGETITSKRRITTPPVPVPPVEYP